MISGVVYIVTFTLLLRDYKPSKKKKTTSWYIDKYLIGFLPVVILTGLMFVAFGESDDGKIPSKHCQRRDIECNFKDKKPAGY